MEVKDLPLDDIVISLYNTRKDLVAGSEDSSLDDLANSIREKGLLNPIIVRISAGGYELIAGQRRLLACKKLGWTKIPALVRSEIDDADATAISLIENVHRAEMNPLDKARAFDALRDRYDGDLNKVSKETGIGAATIKKYLNLLALPKTIQEKISEGQSPARIEALHALTRTFDKEEDMLEVFSKTVGFSQEVVKRILKASGGDRSKIDALVAKAKAGEFDTKLCRGQHGRFMCDYIPDELAPTVVQLVENFLEAREDAKKGKR
jgi:ParB family chromosome partitioning protein